MIRTVKDRETAKLWAREFSRKFQAIESAARKRLELLNAAESLDDLHLPGMRLEALKGERKGQHSIRINDQYRICFVWESKVAFDVEIVDYH